MPAMVCAQESDSFCFFANVLLERIPDLVINGLEQRFPLNRASVRCLLIFKVNFFSLLDTAPPLQLGQDAGGPLLERGCYAMRGGKGAVNFTVNIVCGGVDLPVSII